MFKMFKKDPLKALNDEYAKLLEQARDLQRYGDIKGFAAMTAKAEEVRTKIEDLEKRESVR